MHIEEMAVGQRRALHDQFAAVADVGDTAFQHPPEHSASLLFSLLIGRTVALQTSPDLPGFAGRGVGMQHMATRRRHGGIQHRWDRQHHSIALGIDPTLPVINPDGVDRQILQPRGIESQMQVQKAVALFFFIWPAPSTNLCLDLLDLISCGFYSPALRHCCKVCH